MDTRQLKMTYDRLQKLSTWCEPAVFRASCFRDTSLRGTLFMWKISHSRTLCYTVE